MPQLILKDIMLPILSKINTLCFQENVFYPGLYSFIVTKLETDENIM